MGVEGNYTKIPRGHGGHGGHAFPEYLLYGRFLLYFSLEKRGLAASDRPESYFERPWGAERVMVAKRPNIAKLWEDHEVNEVAGCDVVSLGSQTLYKGTAYPVKELRGQRGYFGGPPVVRLTGDYDQARATALAESQECQKQEKKKEEEIRTKEPLNKGVEYGILRRKEDKGQGGRR